MQACDMSMARIVHACYMPVSYLLPAYYMPITCLLHAYHMLTPCSLPQGLHALLAPALMHLCVVLQERIQGRMQISLYSAGYDSIFGAAL